MNYIIKENMYRTYHFNGSYCKMIGKQYEKWTCVGEITMSVGFQVSYNWYEIGSADFLYAFFSTVAYNLEKGIWGSKFPVIMKRLYLEELNGKDIDRAIKELKIIKRKLKKFSPDKVVWDIENLEKQPPWGKNISDEISDLSNYFITSDGEDFITIFMHALEKAKETGEGIAICNI